MAHRISVFTTPLVDVRVLLGAAALVILPWTRVPAQEATPQPSAPAGEVLSEEARKSAEQLDQISAPTAGEFFAAIDKTGKPEWAAFFRSPIPNTFSNRTQLALHIGGLIADGYVAVAAQDSQQVKNVGRDVINFAKALAVSDDLIARGNSIVEFADNFEWSALREELEATQNEVKLALSAQKDEMLITLVTLGGWIRAADIASGVVLKSYNPDAARLIRQPALVAVLRSKIDALAQPTRDDPLMKEIAAGLAELESLLKFAPDHSPTVDEVKAMNVLTARLIALITGQESVAAPSEKAPASPSPEAAATR